MMLKLTQIIPEDKLIQKFGFTKNQLDDLRNKQDFPSITICQGVRAYVEPDVIRWLLEKRKGKIYFQITDKK